MKQVARFKLKVEAKRVLAGGSQYEATASGEGRFLKVPLKAIFTHTATILSDGSELATGDGLLRTREGCDVITVQSLTGFHCDPHDKPGIIQCWKGAVVAKSQSVKFMELNGRAFWVEIRFQVDGFVEHRWYALDLTDEHDDDEDDGCDC